MMLEKLKQFIIKLNDFGIPLPLLRDPKEDHASITYTMMVVSYLIVVIGLVGKLSKQLDVDMSQAMYLFMTTSGVYLGRKLQADNNKKTITVESKDETK